MNNGENRSNVFAAPVCCIAIIWEIVSQKKKPMFIPHKSQPGNEDHNICMGLSKLIAPMLVFTKDLLKKNFGPKFYRT